MTLYKIRTEFTLIAIAVLLIVAAPSYAGVEMERSDGGKMYFSKGLVKHVQPSMEQGIWHLMDADKGLFYMISDDKKAYTSTTPQEFCDQFTAMLGGMMEQMMKNLPEEQRKQMEEARKASPKVDVEVKSKGAGGSVAGYDTEKFEISSNGAIYGNAWITRDDSLLDEFGDSRVKLAGMIDKATGCLSKMTRGRLGEPDIAASRAYTSLLDEGLIMKEVHKGKTRYEVKKIERKELPDSMFQVPDGYRKVPFTTLLGIPVMQ